MILDFQLLKGFDRTLQDALFKGLSLGEGEVRERCAGYLKEDPSVEQRRESLLQDLERYEAALNDLQNISGITFDESDNDDDHDDQSEDEEVPAGARSPAEYDPQEVIEYEYMEQEQPPTPIFAPRVRA
jgi:hypothetical protein